jgi:hypothetical protein
MDSDSFEQVNKQTDVLMISLLMIILYWQYYLSIYRNKYFYQHRWSNTKKCFCNKKNGMERRLSIADIFCR